MSYGPPPDQPSGYPPPEQPPAGYQPYGYAPAPNNSTAVTSLVLGIVSLVACGLLTGIPAMVLSRRAKREIIASQGREGGESLATAGFVTGLIGTILSTIGVVLLLVLFAIGAVVGSAVENSCVTGAEGPVVRAAAC